MTDNEIIKALECFNIEHCLGDECPYFSMEQGCTQMMKDVYSLVHRQKAKIKKLEKGRMTDKEIIKALKDCVSCEVCTECDSRGACDDLSKLLYQTSDLIDRQKEEIERLQKENHQFADIGKMHSEAKSEARKEFAERVKKVIDGFREKREMVMLPYTEAALLHVEKNIDNLLEEMESESK